MSLKMAQQSVNVAGIGLFLQIMGGKKELAVPHVSVPDIRWVDWAALREAGFEACVFDKDNTLTVPYGTGVHGPVDAALRECLEVFEGRAVVYSNSAGLQQFDPDGKEAAKLEGQLGVPVLRHKQKKPAGGPEDLEEHFGCEAHRLVMVGDRYLTDVVFGNRLGMLTVRPAPFTEEREAASVRLARRLEDRAVSRWTKGRRPVEPPAHALVPGGGEGGEGAPAHVRFVKDPGVW